jgi:hypothetical protein
MSKPVSERELLELQIKIYEFYSRLIDRAVGGTGGKLPKWDEQRAQEYKELADQLRTRLAELDAQQANGATTPPGITKVESSPEGRSGQEQAIAPE